MTKIVARFCKNFLQISERIKGNRILGKWVSYCNFQKPFDLFSDPERISAHLTDQCEPTDLSASLRKDLQRTFNEGRRLDEIRRIFANCEDEMFVYIQFKCYPPFFCLHMRNRFKILLRPPWDCGRIPATVPVLMPTLVAAHRPSRRRFFFRRRRRRLGRF